MMTSCDYSAMREALAATLSDNFLLSTYPARFDIKFMTAGGTVPKLRNIVYIAHQTENGSKM